MSQLEKSIATNQINSENAIREHYKKINEAIAESEKQVLNKYKQIKENQKISSEKYIVITLV